MYPTVSRKCNYSLKVNAYQVSLFLYRIAGYCSLFAYENWKKISQQQIPFWKLIDIGNIILVSKW